MQRLALGLLGLLLLTTQSFAQSTAQPVVTGYLSASGCPGNQSPCFIQYGSAGGTGGTVTANQGTPNAGTTNSWWVQLYNSLVGVKGRDGSTIMGDSNPLNALCQDTNGTKCDFTLPTITIPSSQYPNGSTPIGGPSTGTTGAVVGTLANTSGKTTYICSFDVSAIGGTAAVGPVTVAGLKGGSAVYQLASSASGVTLQRTFNPCFPASATNTAITVTTTADGTASAVAVNTFGFQL